MFWPFGKKKVIDLTGRAESKVPVKKPAVEGEYADLTSVQNSTASTDLFSVIGNTSSFSQTENLEIKGLKNKIDDVEYKVETLRKRLNDLIDRFEVVEKKLH